MPITVRCHACATRVSAPDAAAGRRVKCPRCGEELSVPLQGAAAPDWMAAPPPVRRPAPAPAPTATSGAADPLPPDADAAPQPPSEPNRYDELEPWYYRYIERYTIVLLCIWIAVLTLIFVAYSVLMLIEGAAVAQVGFGNQTAFGGCAMIFAWLLMAACYALAVCAAIFAAAWLLLALDAARNLRRIRLKLPGD